MANILVLRFSAIGDVAMTVPVVDSLARQYPDNNYTVVSQSFLSPLFEHCPGNVCFVGVNLRREHSGAFGMYRLYRALSEQRFDAVADLHDVLRTKLLRIFFRFFHKCAKTPKIRHIDKGRKEKRLLTRRRNKVLRPLKSTIERYADVFHALGQPLRQLDFVSIYGSLRGDFSLVENIVGKKSSRLIGVAPFAKHAGKMFPLERMERVVAHFADMADVTVFLFGGGAGEKKVLNEWEAKYPQTVSVAGKLDLSAELILISHLDAMLSMDSANMHLASLTATPVVSVWGATHPFAGFYGYNQSPDNIVQIDLPCRPCSVYGNKPCYRQNSECLNDITPQMLIEKVYSLICPLPLITHLYEVSSPSPIGPLA